MRTDNGWLILCGVLAFVLLLNLGIIFSFLRGRGQELRSGFDSLRSPWEAEQAALQDLHDRVEALRNQPNVEERLEYGEQDYDA